MLLSFETARISLARYWWSIGGMNVMALGILLFSLFPNRLSAFFMLWALGLAAGFGLLIGLYLSFRATFNSQIALWGTCYGVIVLEMIFAGGACGAAFVIAERANLALLAILTHCFIMLFSIIGSMYFEASALKFFKTTTSDVWTKAVEKHLDYSCWSVSPLLTNKTRAKNVAGHRLQSMFLIVAIGTANIPLLFELYAGGRANAIFFAAPVMTVTLAYINFKSLGPGLARLLLLRKIEKNAGRRFINADLEKIQELRRSFFLARWLMKDFAPVQMSASKHVDKNL